MYGNIEYKIASVKILNTPMLFGVDPSPIKTFSQREFLLEPYEVLFLIHSSTILSFSLFFSFFEQVTTF